MLLSSSKSAFRFFCFGLDPVGGTTAALFISADCGSGVCAFGRSSSWGPEEVGFGFLVVRLGIGAVLVLRKMLGGRGRRVDSRFPSGETTPYIIQP